LPYVFIDGPAEPRVGPLLFDAYSVCLLLLRASEVFMDSSEWCMPYGKGRRIFSTLPFNIRWLGGVMIPFP